ETYRALLEQQANILTASIKEKRFMPNLQKAVMAGQTCESTTVPLNMYGQCAPQFASAADFTAGKYLGWKKDYTVDLASLPKGKDNGSALRSCQSACPGECITYAVQYDGNGNAVANTSNT